MKKFLFAILLLLGSTAALTNAQQPQTDLDWYNCSIESDSIYGCLLYTSGNKEINVTLKTSANSMEEVVVTGYQNIKRKDLVGSYTTLKADDIIMPAYSSIDQMLQGRVAGMVVTNTSTRCV